MQLLLYVLLCMQALQISKLALHSVPKHRYVCTLIFCTWCKALTDYVISDNGGKYSYLQCDFHFFQSFSVDYFMVMKQEHDYDANT